MRKYGLVSVYTKKKYRVHHNTCNQSPAPNLLDRKFNKQQPNSCVVSDLTYVRVGGRWAYICILLEMHSREIIGFSAGFHKDAWLVKEAFSSVRGSLFDIQMFHTDRGKEFDNQLIDDILEAFHINRSLSMRGCPYDNAVAESTFKTIKTEFIYRRIFPTIEKLRLELADYVHWFNCLRLHGSLNYLSPVQHRKMYPLSFLSR